MYNLVTKKGPLLLHLYYQQDRIWSK